MTDKSSYSVKEQQILLALHIRSDKKCRKVDRILQCFQLMKQNEELFQKRKNKHAQSHLNDQNSCRRPDLNEVDWFKKLKKAPMFDDDGLLNYFSWHFLIDYFYDEALFDDGPSDPDHKMTIKLHDLGEETLLHPPHKAGEKKRKYISEIKKVLTPTVQKTPNISAQKLHHVLQMNIEHWKDIGEITLDIEVLDWPENGGTCLSIRDKSFKNGVINIERSTFENWRKKITAATP